MPGNCALKCGCVEAEINLFRTHPLFEAPHKYLCHDCIDNINCEWCKDKSAAGRDSFYLCDDCNLRGGHHSCDPDLEGAEDPLPEDEHWYCKPCRKTRRTPKPLKKRQ